MRPPAPGPAASKQDLAAAFAKVARAVRGAGVEARLEADGYPGLLVPGARSLLIRYDFRTSPCVDVGRLEEKVPGLWLRPTDRPGLAACLRALVAADVPFKVRGCGHSSGGQVLIAAGAVLDLGGLGRILTDDPARETIRVEGGCTWLALTAYLHRLGRRPRVLTDNLHTTVAGTLAVGGFGDASHRFGLQAAEVTTLELATLDGEIHEVGPGQALFDYSLCGRGQLGVVVGATVRTRRASARLRARTLAWTGLDRFCADAAAACRHGHFDGHFDFFRARLQLGDPPSVRGVVGVLAPEAGNGFDVGFDAFAYPGLSPDELGAPEDLDLFEHLRTDPAAELGHAAPALEVVFPLANAPAAIARFAGAVRESGLAAFLSHGCSIMVLPSTDRLPLAPVPPGGLGVMVALRPRLPEAAAAALLPAIRRLGQDALEQGARLYLMSVEPDRMAPVELLDRQFGPEPHRVFAGLKRVWDPKRLLNPWLL